MPMVVRPDGHHPPKRQKLESSSSQGRIARPSRIFAPFRTVGLVSPTPIPFAAQPLGKTTFHVTTSAGTCLQTYDLRKGLNLVFITRPQTPGPITAVASWADKVLAAWSVGEENGPPAIWVYKRGKQIGELRAPKGVNQDVVEILVYGSWIVGCCTSTIHVWKSDTLEYYTTLTSPFADSDNAVLTGGIVTMPTFANKIFAGRADGSVEIWNVSTGRLVYRILPPDSDAGPVTALQPTPALSLLAIAYTNGAVIIQDVLADQEMIRVNAGGGPRAPITSISFRTDGMGAGPDGQQPGVMATASFTTGDVTFWDMNHGGRRMATLRGAHDATASADADSKGISKIEFLPGQAILVTSGADNALKTWIFDHTPYSPIPRLLHSRSGHAAPINTLDFIPTDADGADFTGKWLLSTSRDRSMWGWSLRRDGQSTELSQGNVQKKAKKAGMYGGGSEEHTRGPQSLKAPEITCVACCLNRDGGVGAMPGDKRIWASAKQLKGQSTAVDQNLTGWESVVTGHKGDRSARTWYWGRKRAGRWVFDTGDGSEVKSVTISPCGTFAIIGSAAGGIDMYNLQSGQHRQRFPPRLTSAQAKKMELKPSQANGRDQFDRETWARGLGKHTGAITGLEVDGLNTFVISCSSDGRIKFWDFLSGRLVHELDWHASVSVLSMKLHRPSNLLAVSCSDDIIRIVDIENRRTVRELRVSSAVQAYCFSNDGRWVVTSSADALVRVYDLPTGHLIDGMRLRSTCTALAFSDTGEFLATAQADSVGVDLWTNKALFRHVPTHPLTDADINTLAAGPAPSGEQGQHILASALADDDEDDDAPNGLEAAEDDPDTAPLPALDQLSHDVETLSLVPRTRWQNLLNLDAIRARNKPVEPPAAPAHAPFFLPSLPGAGAGADANAAAPAQPAPLSGAAATDADGALDSTAEQQQQQQHARTRIARVDAASAASTSRFTALLNASVSPAGGTADADTDTDTDTAMAAREAVAEHLKTLAPSAADVAIRTLRASELAAFVRALTGRLRLRRDYELVQAWMAVFVRCHGDVVAALVEDEAALGEGEDGGLLGAMREWRREQRREGERLGALAGYCAGVVGFLRSAR